VSLKKTSQNESRTKLLSKQGATVANLDDSSFEVVEISQVLGGLRDKKHQSKHRKHIEEERRIIEELKLKH
jgi:hypothetical protein